MPFAFVNQIIAVAWAVGDNLTGYTPEPNATHLMLLEGVLFEGLKANGVRVWKGLVNPMKIFYLCPAFWKNFFVGPVAQLDRATDF